MHGPPRPLRASLALQRSSRATRSRLSRRPFSKRVPGWRFGGICPRQSSLRTAFSNWMASGVLYSAISSAAPTSATRGPSAHRITSFCRDPNSLTTARCRCFEADGFSPIATALPRNGIRPLFLRRSIPILRRPSTMLGPQHSQITSCAALALSLASPKELKRSKRCHSLKGRCHTTASGISRFSSAARRTPTESSPGSSATRHQSNTARTSSI